MKHEVLTRAIGELDDELIADAYAYEDRAGAQSSSSSSESAKASP